LVRKPWIPALRQFKNRKARGTARCAPFLESLKGSQCDAIIYHMKNATVRDLRYRFPEIEAQLREGEEIKISKRRRVIARLVPVKPRRRQWPDFLARLKKIYGRKVSKVTGAGLVSWARGDDR
jgi:antitoxin (DNA-binding transcriptional repressor) of toxin-antitoxin stability system